MRDITRRDALLAGGLGVGTLVAGCLEEEGDEENRGTDETTVGDIEHLQLGTGGQAAWTRDDETKGIAYQFQSQSAYDAAERELLEWSDVETGEFVDETNFSEELLVLVGVIGSNGCYNQATVENLSIEDGEVVGEARATREDEDAEACNDIITYPHALVRADIDGGIPEGGEITVTGPGDDQETIELVPFEMEETTVKETAVLQLGGTGSQPRWYEFETDQTGVVYQLDDLPAEHDADVIPDDEEVEEFLAEHEREDTLLLLVGSVGPRTNYNQLSFENISLEDEVVTGDVRVKAEGDVGGDAITYPWALLAVKFEGAVPGEAAFEITDGWGETSRVSTEDGRSVDPESLAGYIEPDGDPDVVPETLECEDEEFERHPQGTDEDKIVFGDRESDGEPTWSMRVEETSYELGETVAITLTNVSERELVTGNSSKHNIQLYTEEGWQDVRGYETDSPVEYTDEGILHPAGDGFEWTVELSEEGIISENENVDRLSVCPDLQPGRYRFVFWDPALAVAFDVEE